MKFNVGGTVFQTKRSVLSKYNDKIVEQIEKCDMIDSQGLPFIDMDPVSFRIILNWLRTDHIDIGSMNIEQMKREMTLYDLPEPEMETIEIIVPYSCSDINRIADEITSNGLFKNIYTSKQLKEFIIANPISFRIKPDGEPIDVIEFDKATFDNMSKFNIQDTKFTYGKTAKMCANYYMVVLLGNRFGKLISNIDKYTTIKKRKYPIVVFFGDYIVRGNYNDNQLSMIICESTTYTLMKLT